MSALTAILTAYVAYVAIGALYVAAHWAVIRDELMMQIDPRNWLLFWACVSQIILKWPVVVYQRGGL